MNKAAFFLAFILSFSFTIQGCKPAAKNETKYGKVLATVNGVPITGDEVMLQLGGHEQFLNTPVMDQTLDNIIDNELLYQEGVKLGLDKDRKFQSNVRLLELRVKAYKRAEIARRVRNTQIDAKIKMTSKDVKDYYDKHAEEIGTDLHLGVLQFADRVKADQALARIRSGVSFQKLGAEEPKGPAQKWDKGFLHWNQIPIEFADQVYGLKNGQVSGVLTANNLGIYIIKVIDRKKNPKAGFANMKVIIENRLVKLKTREAFDRYVEKLKEESTIKKFQDGKRAS